MDPLSKFQAQLIVMQVMAFIFGMLFERALCRRAKNEDER